jgi:hypothetical protein
MKHVKHWLLTLLLTFLATSDAAAATISGSIKYTRNLGVVGPRCSDASRIKCTDNGLSFGIAGVQTFARNVSGGALFFGSATSASGNYSITVPTAGTWLVGWQYRDGTIGDCHSGNRGNASVAIVTYAVGGTCSVVAGSGNTIAVPTASSAVTNNVVVGTAHAESGKANQWGLAMLQKNVWLAEYGASILAGKWRLRMNHVNGTASCGAQCDAAGQDCIFTCGINTAVDGLTLLHETGHGVMQQIQFNALGRTFEGPQTTQSCNTAGATVNQARNFEEAFADFIEVYSQWSPTTVPQFVRGNDCTSSSGHGPLTQVPVPGAPACGTGSVATGRTNVLRGLIDLADANTVLNQPACRVENVQVPITTMLAALTKFSVAGSLGTAPSQCFGIGETGLGEGCMYFNNGTLTAVPSTPAWPYTGVSAGLPVVDQAGFLDYLGILKQHYGISGTGLFDVWANSSWARGDSAVQLP